MVQTVPDGDALKEAFKEALAETLHEQRGLLREAFVEELEDLPSPKPFEKANGPDASNAMQSSSSWRSGVRTAFRRSFERDLRNSATTNHSPTRRCLPERRGHRGGRRARRPG
jgi:hypothetical protein